VKDQRAEYRDETEHTDAGGRFKEFRQVYRGANVHKVEQGYVETQIAFSANFLDKIGLRQSDGSGGNQKNPERCAESGKARRVNRDNFIAYKRTNANQGEANGQHHSNIQYAPFLCFQET